MQQKFVYCREFLLQQYQSDYDQTWKQPFVGASQIYLLGIHIESDLDYKIRNHQI